MQPYSSTDTATARKNSCFILSKRLDFELDDSLSLVVHTLSMQMLTSLSVDKILLPMYINWNIYFRI